MEGGLLLPAASGKSLGKDEGWFLSLSRLPNMALPGQEMCCAYGSLRRNYCLVQMVRDLPTKAATPLRLLRVVTQTAAGLNYPNVNSFHTNIITDLRTRI